MSTPMPSSGPGGGMGPVMVLNAKTKRQTGRAVPLANIDAAQAVAQIVRTTLGPQAMLKMLLDPMGNIVLTNDGHAILRELTDVVVHPTAKSLMELARAQEEEVGDGTTSVLLLAASVLQVARPFLAANVGNSYHPTVIVQAYTQALHIATSYLQHSNLAVHVQLDNPDDKKLIVQMVESTIGTKVASQWRKDLKLVDMAIAAVKIVTTESSGGMGIPMVDLKRYAKVEKIPGGEWSDCQVVRGVVFQKDVVHSKMPRRIKNPRILLLDTPLEYKKGESQTQMEISEEQDWNALLQLEEEYVELQCRQIIALKPDIVITEKGVSDLAQHFLQKAGIAAFRRLRKTDNNRIAKAVGATVVSRTDEIQESDIGTGCGLMEMRKLGDDWFCFLEECENPKACSIVLRGASKDVLNEVERNLQDAMQVVRNIVLHPSLLPGGGATEMAVAVAIKQKGQSVLGLLQAPLVAIGEALEVIPRTLAQNCGVSSVIRVVTELRAVHAKAYNQGGKPCHVGIHGITGELVDMKQYGIWEPASVKLQTLKTSIENACLILRIDDVVSGSKVVKH